MKYHYKLINKKEKEDFEGFLEYEGVSIKSQEEYDYRADIYLYTSITLPYRFNTFFALISNQMQPIVCCISKLLIKLKKIYNNFYLLKKNKMRTENKNDKYTILIYHKLGEAEFNGNITKYKNFYGIVIHYNGTLLFTSLYAINNGKSFENLEKTAKEIRSKYRDGDIYIKEQKNDDGTSFVFVNGYGIINSNYCLHDLDCKPEQRMIEGL